MLNPYIQHVVQAVVISYWATTMISNDIHVQCNPQIIPFFEVCLKLPQNAGKALAEGSTKVTTPVLVAYLAGVLATFTKVQCTCVLMPC